MSAAGLRRALIGCLWMGLSLAGAIGPTVAEETITEETIHGRVLEDVLSDHSRFYSSGNLRSLSLGLLGAWLLANTEADVSVQDWYREEIRTRASDDAAGWVKPLGDGRIMVPALSATLLAGRLIGETSAGRTLGRWSGRSLRALAVGAPALLLLQVATGGSRPIENDSRWRPFEDDNGVSGHSFVGAVPFLSAAGMSENRLLRPLLYAGSSLCGLSRINDDAHYLSQSAMGWWVAFLACRSVDWTESKKRGFQLLPAVPGEGGEAGITVVVAF